MVRERWQPSLGWRAVMAVHLVLSVGFCYVIMRLFFPRVFLLPAVIAATVLAVGCCIAPLRAQLDHSAGELAITTFWTEHVPLARIKRVEELPFGVGIKAAGIGYRFGGRGWYFRLLKRLLRIRTGFEGMERAVAQAVATARAASPEKAEPEGVASQPGVLIACLFLGGGLFALAVAVAVQPQAGLWIVHVVAWALRIWLSAGGFMVMLLGAWFLHSALRNRRSVRWLG